MKVFFSTYQLVPLKRANRLSSLEPKAGVFVKGVLGNTVSFADYFPHLSLGDRPVDLFLEEFKYQKNEYDQKVFDFILKDPEYQNQTPKKILLHQLWTGSEEIEAATIKYKLLHAHDHAFMTVLEKGHRLRLDGNGLFTSESFAEFVKQIPEKYRSLIEYIEDPSNDKNWKKLSIPTARDFIESDQYDYYIYKPNCEFMPKTDKPVIFSAYLGGELGRWHVYCELVQQENLNHLHGIHAPNFYQGEHQFLQGNYSVGFTADMTRVRKLYQELSQLPWKSLCSM